MAREIQLTQGQVAIVDDEDFEYLNQWKWCHTKSRGSNTGYAMRAQIYSDGTREGFRMHRVVLNTPEGKSTDHINGNGLDNRRCNLRIATNSENQYNKGKYKNNISGYKGVHWDKYAKKWKAQIRISKIETHIGLYVDVVDAALAYNAMATKYHGEFAQLNSINS